MILPSMIAPRGPCTPSGGHAFSRLRVRARRTIAVVALIAPAALCGQGLGRTEAVLQRGPIEAYARAGIGALVDSDAVTTSPASTSVADSAKRDSSNQHESRAHHVGFGAVIGGAVGLVLGIAGDRPGGLGLGRGEMGGGHFNNLWVVTVPLGAVVGALVGSIWATD